MVKMQCYEKVLSSRGVSELKGSKRHILSSGLHLPSLYLFLQSQQSQRGGWPQEEALQRRSRQTLRGDSFLHCPGRGRDQPLQRGQGQRSVIPFTLLTLRLTSNPLIIKSLYSKCIIRETNMNSPFLIQLSPTFPSKIL